MPNAVFTHRASVARSMSDVWTRLQEAETWSNIGPVEEVWDAVHNDRGQLDGYRWSASVGPRKYKGTAEAIAREPEHLMQLSLDGGEVAGTLTTRLSANGDGGTHIEVTLDIQSRGPLSTMFFPIVADAVGRGLPRQVERFAESFEES